jgi:excisionase family DNA binding protein
MMTAEWLTTDQAAEYLASTRRALLNAVSRGRLVPDAWGGRGRAKGHRFRRETLDRYITGEDECQRRNPG